MKQKSCLVVIKLLQWERAICKTLIFFLFCVRAHYIESLKDVPKFKMGHLNLKFEFKNVKVFFFFLSVKYSYIIFGSVTFLYFQK